MQNLQIMNKMLEMLSVFVILGRVFLERFWQNNATVFSRCCGMKCWMNEAIYRGRKLERCNAKRSAAALRGGALQRYGGKRCSAAWPFPFSQACSAALRRQSRGPAACSEPSENGFACFVGFAFDFVVLFCCF